MADYLKSSEEDGEQNPESSPQQTPQEKPPTTLQVKPPEKTPEETLKSLQDELTKTSDDLGKNTKKLAALKTDVESLTKTVDEFIKAKTAFGNDVAALADLRQKIDQINEYYRTKEGMVESALGEKKKEVDKKIAEVEASITAKEKTEIPHLEAAAKTACDADQDAQKKLAEAQQEYDDLKNLQKSIGDKIKTLTGFKTRIEEFDDKTKPASMYVILRELEDVLHKTKIPETQVDFDTELAAAFKKLADAKLSAREKKLACEAAKADLAKAQSDLATLKKNRVEIILKEVEPYNEAPKATEQP